MQSAIRAVAVVCLLGAAAVALTTACAEREIPEARDVQGVCEETCALLFACEGYPTYDDTEAECVQGCSEPNKPQSRLDACGDAHWAFANCFVALSCEDVLRHLKEPATDPSHPCHKEQVAIVRDCT